MVRWLMSRRCGPIGVDIGSRAIKLVQLNADRTEVHEAVRWDVPAPAPTDPRPQAARIAEAVTQALDSRNFRGREAVMCLNSADLFVQNIRVPQATGDELRRVVHTEAASRLPFEEGSTELRYVEADNVRQGDAMRREVILLASQRPSIARLLDIADASKLIPMAIDVEPAALLRCYSRLFRREADQEMRGMFVNLGASTTTVIIARGSDPLFIKNIDFGGRHLDEAVSRHLKMRLSDATALRRHNGDRRSDMRDPEVARSVNESVRPVLDRLANEVSMCARYHSVTFRGQPLSRVVLGGGEASPTVVEWLQEKIDVPCELGDPLRVYERPALPGRTTQWDVAVGLALRER
ncbi:MAG: pilus assembly protein PilM [Pirellulales bacterium]|nr:pilus assembly protein PilM [Pirellulales bacterium]